jgi:hypothetical protein
MKIKAQMDKLINALEINTPVGLSFISGSLIIQILAIACVVFIVIMRHHAFSKTLKMINEGKNIGYAKINGVGEIGEKRESPKSEKEDTGDT